uniref:MADF domain-containing protein n=1 Tax=Ciona savignyi TaxID=51511 RepID=H2Z149_CIOSA
MTTGIDDETFNRKLIDVISGLALLYNQFHPDKKNKHKTESAWKEVSATMDCSGTYFYDVAWRYISFTAVQWCQTRWNNLKSTYDRTHKKARDVPSGSGTHPPPTWPYFGQLSFLEGYVTHRRSKDNFFQALEVPVQEEPMKEGRP